MPPPWSMPYTSGGGRARKPSVPIWPPPSYAPPPSIIIWSLPCMCMSLPSIGMSFCWPYCFHVPPPLVLYCWLLFSCIITTCSSSSSSSCRPNSSASTRHTIRMSRQQPTAPAMPRISARLSLPSMAAMPPMLLGPPLPLPALQPRCMPMASLNASAMPPLHKYTQPVALSSNNTLFLYLKPSDVVHCPGPRSTIVACCSAPARHALRLADDRDGSDERRRWWQAARTHA
mmetsp:Transcript_901/g.2052  ORF Transcript_901/g.2052 Transcript_901/m.2052 type:complete len:230 (+) Transcript_901:424-1113(+)